MSDYNACLEEALKIEGALAVAIVDADSGMALAQKDNGAHLDLNIVAAANGTVARTMQRTITDLGLKENIEDILISLDSQYHIIRGLGNEASHDLFMYLVLDRSKATLAMARYRLAAIERELKL